MKKYYLLVLCSCLFFAAKLNAQSFSPGGGTGAIFVPSPIIIPGPSPTDYVINFNPVSNYHFYNPFTFNPAMAGIENKRRINLNWNRQNHHAFSGAYEQPIAAINSTFGIQYEYRKETFGEMHRYGLAYNYGFHWGEETQLKLGVQFSQINIFVEEFSFFPLQANEWHSLPSMDFGVAFQFKQLRLGVSAQNLIAKKLTQFNELDGSILSQLDSERMLNFSAANTFKLSKKWDWSAAFLLRFSNQKFYEQLNFYYTKEGHHNQHDFSTYLSFNKKYSVGTTFRTQYEENVWIGFVGIKLKEKMNLQFSYNVQKEDDTPRFWEFLTQYQF